MDYTTVLAKAAQTLEQRKDRSAGSINGREYARIVNGIPYRIAN